MPKAKNAAPAKSTLSAAARAAIARTAASRKALYAGRHEPPDAQSSALDEETL